VEKSEALLSNKLKAKEFAPIAHILGAKTFASKTEDKLKRKLRACIVFSLTCLIFISIVRGEPLSGQSAPRILISNDDGIDALGLAALFKTLSKVGTVIVAAPSQNYSGAGHSMTFYDPIMVTESEKAGSRWFAIKATPATCVRLALESLVTDKPDIVVTGINKGENLGTVTFYSGTVGGAREAAVKGIPAIAVSLENGPVMDYGPAAEFIAGLVQELKDRFPKPGTFLNVNVPNLPKKQIKGVMTVPQDTRPSHEFYERRINPSRQIYFWSAYKELEAGTEKTDVWAVRNGYISLTALQIDQTDHAGLKTLGSLSISNWKK
jgi:5'-nucleotidase